MVFWEIGFSTIPYILYHMMTIHYVLTIKKWAHNPPQEDLNPMNEQRLYYHRPTPQRQCTSLYSSLTTTLDPSCEMHIDTILAFNPTVTSLLQVRSSQTNKNLLFVEMNHPLLGDTARLAPYSLSCIVPEVTFPVSAFLTTIELGQSIIIYFPSGENAKALARFSSPASFDLTERIMLWIGYFLLVPPKVLVSLLEVTSQILTS